MIPHGPASGGLQAGSVFSRIAERIYAKHLFRDLAQAKDSTSVLIPHIKGGDIEEAAYVLRALHIPGNSQSIPQSDEPIWGKASCTSQHANLRTISINQKLVPNVIGMGAKDAVYLLESHGLKVHLSGVGKVDKQSIPSGSILRKGQTILLTLKH